MNYQQDFKQLLKLYTVNGNFDAPLYHCQQDSVQLPCNYYCSLVVCGQTYSTTYAHPSKNLAESEAAKLACEQLNLLSTVYRSGNPPSSSFVTDNHYDSVYAQHRQYNASNMFTKTGQQNQYSNNNRTTPYSTPQKFSQRNNASEIHDTPVNSKKNPNTQELRYRLKTLPVDTSLKVMESSPIPVSSINDVWKYMHGDVLANAMKSIAAFVAQEENIRFPIYKSEKMDKKLQGISLYMGECILKDQVFQSLGKHFSEDFSMIHR